MAMCAGLRGLPFWNKITFRAARASLNSCRASGDGGKGSQFQPPICKSQYSRSTWAGACASPEVPDRPHGLWGRHPTLRAHCGQYKGTPGVYLGSNMCSYFQKKCLHDTPSAVSALSGNARHPCPGNFERLPSSKGVAWEPAPNLLPNCTLVGAQSARPGNRQTLLHSDFKKESPSRCYRWPANRLRLAVQHHRSPANVNNSHHR